MVGVDPVYDVLADAGLHGQEVHARQLGRRDEAEGGREPLQPVRFKKNGSALFA